MYEYVSLNHKKKIRLNPLTLILMNAFLPVVNTLFPSTKGLAFTMIFAMTVLLFFGSFKTFLKTGAFVIIFYALYYLTSEIVRNEMLSMLFKMTVLFVPMFILAFLLITAYNSSEILSALERLRLPKIFVISLTVTLRYIPTFKKEFGIIRDSMKIRGVNFTLKKPMRTFEYLLVPQLFRCLSLSNELTSAALTKGLNVPNKRTSYFAKKFTVWDGAVTFVLLLGFGLIIGKVI